MSNNYTLTDRQLSFITFMNERMTAYPSPVRNRFKARMADLKSAAETSDKISQRNLSEETTTLQHHSPRMMVEFLSLFSRDDHFKWYTHKWDNLDLSLANLRQNQQNKISLLSERVFGTATPVNMSTYRNVMNFIKFRQNPEDTQKYFWIDDTLKRQFIGWASVVKLSEEQPEEEIENILLPDGYRFKDYIRKFKTAIEFRIDLERGKRFVSIIRRSLRTGINGAVKVVYTSDFDKIGEDVNIYCDVPSLLTGLTQICEWIVKHKSLGGEIIVDLSSVKDGYELTIFQKGSYFSNLEKLQHPSGDFAKLRDSLFSICDFTMMGDIKSQGAINGSVTVYGLESETVRREIKKNDKKTSYQLNSCRVTNSPEVIGGVKYILKLYKL